MRETREIVFIADETDTSFYHALNMSPEGQRYLGHISTPAVEALAYNHGDPAYAPTVTDKNGLCLDIEQPEKLVLKVHDDFDPMFGADSEETALADSLGASSYVFCRAVGWRDGKPYIERPGEQVVVGNIRGRDSFESIATVLPIEH